MCLKFVQISEILKNQRNFPIPLDLPIELSTETVDAFGLDQGVNFLQASRKNQDARVANQVT